jgi:hypothetical protein
MSWRDAPLYVEAHDLAVASIGRATTWSAARGTLLAPVLVRAAGDLLDEVSLALTFPQTRAAHLERADHAVVRLRGALRLARDLGLLSPGALRQADERLGAIGRMIGGWRRRPAARDLAPEASDYVHSGKGPPAARRA